MEMIENLISRLEPVLAVAGVSAFAAFVADRLLGLPAAVDAIAVVAWALAVAVLGGVLLARAVAHR